MTKNIKMVIFDWNGTLIDDVWLSVNSVNAVLEKRMLKPITTEFYKEHFRFPVTEFYQEIGLDITKELDRVTREFGEHYIASLDKLKLFRDIIPILEELKKEGIDTGIFSAMEHDMLNHHVEIMRISKYFRFIEGIEDVYAGGKVHLGKKILEKSGYSKDEILFVGDTCHDYETAQAIGCNAALISRGHNSAEKLAGTGMPVFSSMTELLEFIRG